MVLFGFICLMRGAESGATLDLVSSDLLQPLSASNNTRSIKRRNNGKRNTAKTLRFPDQKGKLMTWPSEIPLNQANEVMSIELEIVRTEPSAIAALVTLPVCMLPNSV